jgi:hypothetical protein
MALALKTLKMRTDLNYAREFANVGWDLLATWET